MCREFTTLRTHVVHLVVEERKLIHSKNTLAALLKWVYTDVAARDQISLAWVVRARRSDGQRSGMSVEPLRSVQQARVARAASATIGSDA